MELHSVSGFYGNLVTGVSGTTRVRVTWVRVIGVRVAGVNGVWVASLVFTSSLQITSVDTDNKSCVF